MQVLALLISLVGQPVETSSTSSVASPQAPAKLHPDDPRADRTGTPPLPPRENPAPPPSAEPGVERPLPSYDGRPPPAPGSGEVLIWLPRAAFFPAWVVLEYGLRRPMVGLITLNERYKISNRVGKVFTFRDGKSGIFPTAFVDFGLRPSVGFFTYHEDILLKNSVLSAQGGFWADNWTRIAVSDQLSVFDGSGTLSLRFEYQTRPDDPFYGVGFASRDQDEQFLRFRRFDGEIGLASFLSGLNRVGLSLRFRDGLLEAGQAPAYDGPTNLVGFGDGYQLLGAQVTGTIDTRDVEKEFTGGSGLRFDLRGGFHFDPGKTDLAFFRLASDAAAFWDLTGKNHVLALQLYADVLERTSDTAVPYSELILLGGTEYLRGYLGGRFRGESAFAATLSYRYPIWVLLDAELFTGVGNAFGRGFQGFSFERLVLNWGLGLRLGISRESSVDLLVAFGTTRFDEEDFEVDSFRFTFGANHGF